MVGIVILCYGGAEYTKKCVQSVIDYTTIPYTIIIVDNCSQDDGKTKKLMKELSEKYPDKIVTLYSDRNLGYSGGNNLGMKYAYEHGFEYILILNNDTIVTVNWLELMMEKMNMTEDSCYLSDIGLVGCVSNYAGGSQGIVCELNNLKQDEITEQMIQDFAVKWQAQNKSQWFEVTNLVGLCLLIKRNVIDRIGYFDEIYQPGMWEDNDYCMRAKLKGIKMVVSKDVFIWHYGSKTITELGKDKGKEIFLKNKEVFVNKWDRIFKIGQHKKIVGAARIKNVAKYIKETLTMASQICDEIVIHDGMSDDGTYEICKTFPKVVEIKRAPHPIDFGGSEAEDRNEVIQMAKARNPDFIYCIDGDEVFESKAPFVIQKLLNRSGMYGDLFVFPVFTFWNDYQHFRVDGIWGGMQQGRIFRNLPNQKIYYRKEFGLMHSGAHPLIPQDSYVIILLRLKHYGYVDPIDRKRKYDWYTKTDTFKNSAMILGSFEKYYKKLYYGDENYPIIKDEDYYRHLIDETGMVLKKWIEVNTVSLVMIAKNEEKYLETCIQSVLPVIDEIVLVDTGSTDNTINIAKKYNANIYYYRWQDEFSGPRNLSLRAAKGHWILRMDPDELIASRDLPALWSLFQDDNVDVVIFPVINYLEDPYKVQNPKWALSETCRLFKNDPRFYYQGIVHEELDNSIIDSQKRGEKVVITRSPVVLHHFGYLKEQNYVKSKLDKYVVMNKRQIEVTPDSPGPYHALGLHYYEAREFRKAIRCFNMAIKKDKNFWMAWNDLANICLERKQYYKALKLFKKAAEVQPKGTNPVLVKKVQENILMVQEEIDRIKKHRKEKKIKEGKKYEEKKVKIVGTTNTEIA